MKFEKVRNYINECLAISVIKFILIPLIVSATAFLLGYGEIEEGLPFLFEENNLQNFLKSFH